MGANGPGVRHTRGQNNEQGVCNVANVWRMSSLDAGDEDVSAQCDIPGGCQHQVTSDPCPSVTSGSAADQSEEGWVSSCPIRRQHFGSPTSPDGQNIAGMVTTY